MPFSESFSLGIGGFNAEAAEQPQVEPPRGRAIFLWPGDRRNVKADKRKGRQLVGLIPPDVEEVIIAVAQNQADTLQQDAQKRFEQLHRELALRSLEWEGRYLEAMNQIRQSMIDDEIAERIQRKLKTIKEDEELMMILLASE